MEKYKTLDSTEKKIKPFLRWAGGKNWFTKYIEDYLPENFTNYYEPFLGGGSVFFYLKSKGYIRNKAFLSDSNIELINTYKVIKSSPEDLINCLKTHIDTEEYYYMMRDQVFSDSIERAAKFLFLNKTSFNGIYRVNSQGVYNVPYGKRFLDTLYDYDHILEVSELLDKTFFSAADFKIKCRQAETNDFVFIDPPYTVAHENNGFVQYNQSIFSWKNQIQLSKIVENYHEKNINFLVTNACHDSISQLYTTGQQTAISRASVIGGKGAKRQQYRELLITNIER